MIVSGIEQGLFVVHPNLSTDLTRTSAKPSLTAYAAGLPAGASAVFDLLHGAVPGTSELTLTTNGAAPGADPFTVPARHRPVIRQFRNYAVLESRARRWRSPPPPA